MSEKFTIMIKKNLSTLCTCLQSVILFPDCPRVLQQLKLKIEDNPNDLGWLATI